MVLAIIAGVMVFFAVTTLVAVILQSSGSGAEARLDRLAKQRNTNDTSSVGSVLRSDSGTFPFLRGVLSSNRSQQWRRDLDQAGLTLKNSEYIMMRAMFAAFAALIVVLVTSGSLLGVVLGTVAAVIGWMLPAWFVAIRRSRRQAAINKQLPEMITLISNSLRSGFAFTQAVELAAKQIDPPIGEELNQFIRDTSLGMPTDEALLAMVQRTGSYDLDMMVSSILIQRTTGGNLSEVLDNVAQTVRERERLQGEIRALTASQRFTGFILSIYPIGLFLVLLALAPSIWSGLFTHEVGRLLLVIAGVLQVVGIISISRILRLEV